jgi:ubiquinone/menaquinone biosynthesis C-methylase UbiE
LDEPDPVSAGYDSIYRAYPRSPTLQNVWREGRHEPTQAENLDQIGFVTVAELRQLAGGLGLPPDATLIDLGCGLGGPGLWLAASAGAHLIGVDISGVAVARAQERAAACGQATSAAFRVAALEDTGLEADIADGAVSIDVLQYVPNKLRALREIGRVLRPGGRLALTAFELDPEQASGLPVYGLDPVADFRPLLEEAGFAIEAYEETAGWAERVRRTFEAVVEAREQLASELDERAASSLAAEAAVALRTRVYRRRVLAIAQAS